MSGFMDIEELVGALGEKHLNLGVKDDDVRALATAMDSNGDGVISYAEFVKFLEVHDTLFGG